MSLAASIRYQRQLNVRENIEVRLIKFSILNANR